MNKYFCFFSLLATSLCASGIFAAAPAGSPKLAALPIDFVENRGQWDTPIKFVGNKGPMSAAFEKESVTLRVVAKEKSASVRLVFENAASTAELVGEDKRGGVYNYFIGNDPKRWQSEVSSFGSVLYRGIYEGIDLRVREESGLLEYDLIVAPGADLSRARLRTDGANDLEIAQDGSLTLKVGDEQLRQSAPKTWEQLPDGTKRAVECRFRKIDDQHYGFEVPQRDHSLGLTIDPGLEWSTFLGGSAHETITGIGLARDGSGDVIVAGQTTSPDFPHTGGNQAPVGGTPYVARMNASGSALVYCTFFGGTFNHLVTSLAVDAQSQPVLGGDTNSLDFPVTAGAYDTTPGDGFHGDYDAFVIKFNATGSSVLFGTYLAGQPGTGNEQTRALAFDSLGNVIVAGVTSSDSFPTTVGAYDTTANVYNDTSISPPQRVLLDIFLARLSADGSRLTYSTFFGGEGFDNVYNLVVDPAGIVTITGGTSQLSNTDVNGNEIPLGRAMPTTAGAFQTTYQGRLDAFVARFKLDGLGTADLKYATFLGGKQYTEAAAGLAFNPANPNEITVSGFTGSGDFPTTVGALLRTHYAPVDSTMAFVTRFNFDNPANGSLVWSTFFGGPGGQSAEEVAIDNTGAAIIAGSVGSTNPTTTDRAFDRLPVKRGMYDRTDGPVTSAYVTRISADGSRLLYSTLLGGKLGEGISHMALVGGQTVIVGGSTASTDFPTTPGAFDRAFAADGRPAEIGVEDAFIARMTLQTDDTDITPPSAPALVSPASASSFSAPTTITLDWDDVSDASGIEAYHVQLSPDPNFHQDLGSIAGSFHENWLPLSFAVIDRSISNTGTFYWRVQALDKAHNLGPWSAVRTLVVNNPTPPDAPILTSPANNGRYAPGSITLAWNPAARANFYELQVDTNSAFSNPNRIWIQGITSTQQTVQLPNEGSYFWRVRGTNESPSGGALSAVRSFQLKRGSPAAPIPPPPTSNPPSATVSQPVTVSVNPPSIYGNTTAQGTVTLKDPAPTGGAQVSLFSHDPLLATVPPSVTVPAGARTASFTVSGAPGVDRTAAVAIAAQYQGITHGTLVMVFPDQPVTSLYSFNLSATSVTGGNAAQGTVSLIPGWTAPAGGLIVALSSSNPALASVPAQVVIPPGATSVSFGLTTSAVSGAQQVTIRAARSVTKDVVLTVNPPAAAAPPLTSVTVFPSTVTGGTTTQGTAGLAANAPAGGVVVTLSSSNTAAATVPATVTIPAGANFVNFNVTTKAVSSSTIVTLSGTSAGVTKTTTLGVNAGAPAPPPNADTVSIGRADYTTSKRQLRIDATSSSSSATLTVSVTSTGATLGTLNNNGGGKYSGQLNVTSNPGNITVKSGLGGAANRAVTAN